MNKQILILVIALGVIVFSVCSICLEESGT